MEIVSYNRKKSDFLSQFYRIEMEFKNKEPGRLPWDKAAGATKLEDRDQSPQQLERIRRMDKICQTLPRENKGIFLNSHFIFYMTWKILKEIKHLKG